MYDVRLQVNGVAYGGFQRGRITLSLESLCGDFEFEYIDAWSDEGVARPIRRGDRCELTVDGSTVIDGWVDDARRGYNSKSRSFSVSGRSTTCDLVDCAAMNRPGSWSRQKLSRIVADLCEPFPAIRSFVFGDEGDAIGTFALQRGGEGVGDAILRATRLRGMIPYAVGADLVIARAGSNRTTTRIERGSNVLQADSIDSGVDRFSEYFFKGQTRGNDDVNGIAAAHIHGSVLDREVTRHRPMFVQAGGAEGTKDLGVRAITERNQRAGRGERFTYAVTGWKTDEGSIWEPNLLVRVVDDELDVDDDLLVVGVTFSYDGTTGRDGYVTTLELCGPGAFDSGETPRVRKHARPRARRSRYLVTTGFGTGSSLLADEVPSTTFARGALADGTNESVRLARNTQRERSRAARRRAPRNPHGGSR